MQLPGIKDALWYVRGLGATGKVLFFGQEPLSTSAERSKPYLQQFTAQGSLTCRAKWLGGPENNASLKLEPEDLHWPRFLPGPALLVLHWFSTLSKGSDHRVAIM